MLLVNLSTSVSVGLDTLLLGQCPNSSTQALLRTSIFQGKLSILQPSSATSCMSQSSHVLYLISERLFLQEWNVCHRRLCARPTGLCWAQLPRKSALGPRNSERPTHLGSGCSQPRTPNHSPHQEVFNRHSAYHLQKPRSQQRCPKCSGNHFAREKVGKHSPVYL